MKKVTRLKNFQLELLLKEIEKVKKIRLPGKVTFVMQKNTKLISEASYIFEKAKQTILENHSEKDEKGKFKTIENGTKYDITKENLVIANVELNSINNEEVDFDLLTFDEVLLDKLENITIEEAEILAFFIN